MLYLHGDHLGSVSVTTDAAGVVVSRQDFKPFGELRKNGVWQTTLNYTGQHRDATGLLFYNARYYDPALGQFISPDTIVPGTASGTGGGAATLGYDARTALAPLTVSFAEPPFLAGLNAEHRFTQANGFWFQLGVGAKSQAKVGWGPVNPQALNRYAYVLNNPVRYTDPTGHSACAGISHPGLRLACQGGPFLAWAAGAVGAAIITACIATGNCGGVSELLDWATRTGLEGTTRVGDIGELDEKHLDAAYREANGEVVVRKNDGTPYDHIGEVQQGINRLDKRLAALRRRLAYAEGYGHDKTDEAERERLRDEIREGERLRQRAEDAMKGITRL